MAKTKIMPILTLFKFCEIIPKKMPWFRLEMLDLRC